MATKTTPLASVRVRIHTPTCSGVAVIQIGIEVPNHELDPSLREPTCAEALAALVVAGRHAQQLINP